MDKKSLENIEEVGKFENPIKVGNMHPNEMNEITYSVWGLYDGGFEIGDGFKNTEEEALDLAYEKALVSVESNRISPLWTGTPKIIDKTSRGKLK